MGVWWIISSYPQSIPLEGENKKKTERKNVQNERKNAQKPANARKSKIRYQSDFAVAAVLYECRCVRINLTMSCSKLGSCSTLRAGCEMLATDELDMMKAKIQASPCFSDWQYISGPNHTQMLHVWNILIFHVKLSKYLLGIFTISHTSGIWYLKNTRAKHVLTQASKERIRTLQLKQKNASSGPGPAHVPGMVNGVGPRMI